MAAFMPGASPPVVITPMVLDRGKVVVSRTIGILLILMFWYQNKPDDANGGAKDILRTNLHSCVGRIQWKQNT
jgi:hypothetical protein